LDTVNFISGSGIGITGGTDSSGTQFIKFTNTLTGSTGSSLQSGTNYSDYLYWDTSSSSWSVGDSKIHIGSNAGYTGQGESSVAIGSNAGLIDQSNNSIAIGSYAGYQTQGRLAISIGNFAGYQKQGETTVSVGSSAGYQTQGDFAVAVGSYAGYQTQGKSAVAVGSFAGYKTQDEYTVAIGSFSGNQNQGPYSIAIGSNAGSVDQSNNSIAIGSYAGATRQGPYSIAIGNLAAETNQPEKQIVINASDVSLNGVESNAFYVNPIRNATAPYVLYYDSSTCEVVKNNTNQTVPKGVNYSDYLYWNTNTLSWSVDGSNIHIGTNAGSNNQGIYSIAIGNLAAETNQPEKQIVINASDVSLNGVESNACYIAPIREHDAPRSLGYDPSTNEITYSTTPSLYKDLVSFTFQGGANLGISLNNTGTKNVFTFIQPPNSTISYISMSLYNTDIENNVPISVSLYDMSGAQFSNIQDDVPVTQQIGGLYFNVSVPAHISPNNTLQLYEESNVTNSSSVSARPVAVAFDITDYTTLILCSFSVGYT